MNKTLFFFLLSSAVVIAVILVLIPRDNPRDNAQKRSDTPKIQIVTTIYPLEFLAKSIGGDHVEVKNLTAQGGEPHDFEATPQDAITLQNADMIITLGYGIDAWIRLLIEGIDANKLLIIQDHPRPFLDQTDPHFWMHPIFLGKVGGIIEDSLSKIDQRHAMDYKKNFEDLVYKLSEFTMLAEPHIPLKCENKTIIVTHDAFAYLGRLFGFTTLPIASIHDEEPSAGRIAEIIEFAKKNGIKKVFSESTIDTRLADTVAQAVGGAVLILHPLEALSEKERENGEDYFSIMKKNLINIELAFQDCTRI